jgi:ABC-type uncharacterized transport system permease subunit
VIDETVAYRNAVKLFGRVWACWYGFKTPIVHYQSNLNLFKQLTRDSAYLHYALSEVSPIILTGFSVLVCPYLNRLIDFG